MSYSPRCQTCLSKSSPNSQETLSPTMWCDPHCSWSSTCLQTLPNHSSSNAPAPTNPGSCWLTALTAKVSTLFPFQPFPCLQLGWLCTHGHQWASIFGTCREFFVKQKIRKISSYSPPVSSSTPRSTLADNFPVCQQFPCLPTKHSPVRGFPIGGGWPRPSTESTLPLRAPLWCSLITTRLGRFSAPTCVTTSKQDRVCPFRYICINNESVSSG